MQETGQPFTTSTVELIVQSIIKSFALEVIIDAHDGFKVTRMNLLILEIIHELEFQNGNNNIKQTSKWL
jgi:hypothetical protein